MKEKLKRVGWILLGALAVSSFIFYIWFSYRVMCAIPGSRMF